MPVFGPKDSKRTLYDLNSMFASEKGDLYHSAQDLVAWFKVTAEPEARDNDIGYQSRAHYTDYSKNSISGSMMMSGSHTGANTFLNKGVIKFLTGSPSSGRGTPILDMNAMEFVRTGSETTGSYFRVTGDDVAGLQALKHLTLGASGTVATEPSITVAAWIRPPSGSWVGSTPLAQASGSMGIIHKNYQYSFFITTGTVGFCVYGAQNNPAADRPVRGVPYDASVNNSGWSSIYGPGGGSAAINRIFGFSDNILQPLGSTGGGKVLAGAGDAGTGSAADMSSGHGPWYHVAATYDPIGISNSIKIYVNGEDRTSYAPANVGGNYSYQNSYNFDGTKTDFATNSDGVLTGTTAGDVFRIGYAIESDWRDVYVPNGAIGDVAIWKKNLPAEEIRAVYRASLNGMRKARSGYLTNPARVRLHEYDNKYGTDTYHYPPNKRLLGDPDFKGNKKSWFDDKSAIDFHSPFAEAKLYFWKRPDRRATITLEDNRDNPHKVHFSFHHLTGAVGQIIEEDAYTYRVLVGIQEKFSVEKVGRAFIRAVNECKKLHIRAERFYDDNDPGTVFPVKLIQERVGTGGNTLIGVTGSTNIHIPWISSGSNVRDPYPRASGRRFTGGSDIKIVYPIMLPSSSDYLTSSLASPNLLTPQSQESGSLNLNADHWTGGIVAPGVVKRGVSDHSVRHGSIDINPVSLHRKGFEDRKPAKGIAAWKDERKYKLLASGTFDRNEYTRETLTPFDETAHPFSFDFNHNRLVDTDHSTDLSTGGKFFGTGSDPLAVGEGFTSPLRSKHVIEIDLTPVTGSTLLRYATGSGQATMAYFQFDEDNRLGYHIGNSSNDQPGPKRAFRAIGKQQPLVPAPVSSASLEVNKPYIDRLCDNLMVGFGQGTQQRSTTITDPKTEEGKRIWDNGSWASPISTFGFPYHPKYHATSSMTYALSGVIDGPFLFEKAVYVFKARTSGSNVITWGESHNNDAINATVGDGEVGGTGLPAQSKSSWDGNGGWLYTKVDATQPKSYPIYSNLPTFTFFMLNQRKANVPRGIETSVTHVSVMDDGVREVELVRPFNIPTGSQSRHNTSYPNEPTPWDQNNQTFTPEHSVTQGFQVSKNGPGLYVDTIRDLVTFSRLMLCPSQISGTDPMSVAGTLDTSAGKRVLIQDPRTFADTVISGSDPNSDFNAAAGGTSLGSHNLNIDGEIITLAFEARVPATNKYVGGMHLPTGSWPTRAPGVTNHFDDFLQLDNSQGSSNGLGTSSGRRPLGGEFQGADRLYRRKYGLRGEVKSGFDPMLAGEVNVDILKSDYKVSPYLLMPGDELIFGWQTALPMSVSGSSFMHPPPEGITASGSYPGQEYGKPPRAVCMTPTSQSAMPSIQLLPGEGKLYLFGTLLKEGREKIEPTNTPTSLNIHEAVFGGSEVYDQFDTEPAMTHTGTIYDNIVDGGMRTYPLELKHRDSPNARRVTGRASESTAGSTGSFFRGVRLIDESERFYDTYLPDLTEILTINGDSLIDGKSVGVSAGGKMSRIDVTYTTVTDEGNDTSSETTSDATLDVPTPHSGTHNCLVLAMPSFLSNSHADGSAVRVENEGPGDAFDTQWPMLFPFEPKYSTVNRLANPVTKDSLFPVITGSDGSKIRDGKITHVVLTGSGDFIRGLGAPVIDGVYIYHWFKPYYLHRYGTGGGGAYVTSEGHSGRGYMSASSAPVWATAVGSVGTFGYMTRSNGYIIATGSSNYGGNHYRANKHSYAYLCHDADLIANMHPNAFAPGGELHPDFNGTAGGNPTYDWDSVFNASGYDDATDPTNNGIDGQDTTTAAGIPTQGTMDPKTFTMSGSHGSNITGLPGAIPDTEDNRVFCNGLFSPSSTGLDGSLTGSTARSSSVDHIEFNNATAFNLAALYFGCGNGPFNTIQFERSKLAPGKIMEQLKSPSYYQRNLVINYGLVSEPIFRGFKYGVKNVRPQYSSAVFRTTHYGYLRDMLEQRAYSRYTNEDGLQDAAVSAIFMSRDGEVVSDAESTNCQNLSEFCTSSLPYFDGLSVDRGSIPPDMESSTAATQVLITDLSDLTSL